MGYAYDSIHDGTYDAVTNPNPLADSFGTGRGFVDQIYLAGEEVSGGKFYAIDSSSSMLWETPDLGLVRWENAAPVDTGNSSHVALLMNSDNGTSPGDYVQMYVGKKGVDSNGDGSIDFLERNGLRGGTVYYFDPDVTASNTDLPDGQVTGTWTTSTANALRETKLEDVHTNPNNGSQLVISDQTDGVYIVNLDLRFAAGTFDAANSTASFNQIDDDDSGDIGAPDNLTWTVNDLLYVQEDGSNNDMWQLIQMVRSCPSKSPMDSPSHQESLVSPN